MPLTGAGDDRGAPLDPGPESVILVTSIDAGLNAAPEVGPNVMSIVLLWLTLVMSAVAPLVGLETTAVGPSTVNPAVEARPCTPSRSCQPFAMIATAAGPGTNWPSKKKR